MDAKEIRKLRNKMNLNRDEFGKLVGVVGRTIEQYELGSANPSKAVLIHLNNLMLQQNQKKDTGERELSV